MKVKSIKINNFKSFAEENNRIELDDINTIVGKNESGKSNLIEAIGKIDLQGINDTSYFTNNNKNTQKKPNISVVMVPYENEKEKYVSDDETIITLNEQYDIDVSGGIAELITYDEEFQDDRKNVDNLVENVYFSDSTNRDRLNNIVKMIDNAETKVFIHYTYVDNIIELLKDKDSYKEFAKYLEKCIICLQKYYSLFPYFVHLEDDELKTKYTRKDLEDNSKSKVMLKHLLKIIGVNLDDLNQYWKFSKDDDKYNFIDDLNKKIELYIMDGFNNFYKQENVELKINFDNDYTYFIVKTNSKFLDLSERSNGLRWYLNMYIQLLSKTKRTNIENYVILLDEPGVYLHINAQKEILQLFENFASNGNQIIYTTQLPTMIYQDDLYRTRVIIKDDLGNSNIGNNYYTLPHKMDSKQETISPILEAIGMKMKYSFTAMSNEKKNIITEGISDYNYLKAFIYQRKYKTECNIIPSSGVDNIHNIISILIGWGYDYKIIIDQDKQGRKQYDILTKKLLVNANDIKFVNGKNEKEDIDFSIEDLFSKQDKEIIGINENDYCNEKAYYSLEILKKVEKGEYQYSEETMNNFKKIMDEWLN